ncbi:hypothetical protein Tco_0542945, partial [Tanacetum coccineum]
SNLKLLCNFVEKFLGTVHFGNDQFAPILGYGDLIQGNVTIKRVYYVEGLNHNLFLVGQLCDADLEEETFSTDISCRCGASARATPKAHLPYGMFLTRVFRHVMEHYPYLDNGIYDVVKRVMRPLALRQTRRPRSDRGKARHSVSSPSAHHNRGSLSHQGDNDEDDGASRASTPSPTTYLNSLGPLEYQ